MSTPSSPLVGSFAFRYEHSDIPAGVTLTQWRVTSHPARRRPRLRDLLAGR
jgi:hypothetical protein